MQNTYFICSKLSLALQGLRITRKLLCIACFPSPPPCWMAHWGWTAFGIKEFSGLRDVCIVIHSLAAWNLSSWSTKTYVHVSYVVNGIAADSLVTQGTRESAIMIQTRFVWNISRAVVCIVGVLAQFLWEAQAHKVSGRYIIGNC